jgi:DNA-binding MarR family transcriptional regulator
MEATATQKSGATDRELALQLGTVLLSCVGRNGGELLRVIDESGLTFIQMKVLMTVVGSLEDPPTLKAVAERLGLSLPSASRAVDWLVKRELVVRTEDPTDRRQRRLTVSDAGQALADRIMAARLEGLGQFAASLSETERERLNDALELLLEREEISQVYDQYRRQANL